MITELLDKFITAVNNNFDNKPTSYDKLLLKTLPKTINFDNKHLYNRLLSVSHYVASLSDSHAILSYKKIAGIDI